MPGTPSFRRWSAGTPAGWPIGSWPTGGRSASPRPPGWPCSPAPPPRWPTSLRRRGWPAALADFLEALRLPDGADLLGPVPEAPRSGQDGERERYLVRGPRRDGAGLAHALAEVQGVRSARKVTEHVRVQLDPLDLV